MATVRGQSVPPSLAGALGRLVTMAHTDHANTRTSRINSRGLNLATPEELSARAALAKAVGKWFASMWPTHQIHGSPSAFYASRKNDIFKGLFDDQWWHRATKFADQTEYGTPQSVVEREYLGDQEYADTLHRPTRCEIGPISRYYGTPTGHGTDAQPAPGWRGETVDTLFRDIYHAQRRVRFALPRTLAKDDRRPLAIEIGYTIEAESSLRGNRYWFNLATFSEHYFGLSSPPEPQRKPRTYWARKWMLPTEMPGKNESGWSFTKTAITVRDGRPTLKKQMKGLRNYVDIIVTTPPSHGLYYSRNDWVQVWHSHTVNLYVPRAYRE